MIYCGYVTPKYYCFFTEMCPKWKTKLILLTYAVFVYCQTYLCVSNNPMESIAMRIYKDKSILRVLRPEIGKGQQIQLNTNLKSNSSYESLIMDSRWERFPVLKHDLNISSNILSFSVPTTKQPSKLTIKLKDSQNFTVKVTLDNIINNCTSTEENKTIEIKTTQNWSHFQIKNNKLGNLEIIVNKWNCLLNNLSLGENMHVIVEPNNTWILHNLSYFYHTPINFENSVDWTNTVVSFFVKNMNNNSTVVYNINNKNTNIILEPSKRWYYKEIKNNNLNNTLELDSNGPVYFSNFYLTKSKVIRIIRYTIKNKEEIFCDYIRIQDTSTNTGIYSNGSCEIIISDLYKYCTENCFICCNGKCYEQQNGFISYIIKYYWENLTFLLIVLIIAIVCFLCGKYGSKINLCKKTPNLPLSHVNVESNKNVYDDEAVLDCLTQRPTQDEHSNEVLDTRTVHNYEDIPFDQIISAPLPIESNPLGVRNRIIHSSNRRYDIKTSQENRIDALSTNQHQERSTEERKKHYEDIPGLDSHDLFGNYTCHHRRGSTRSNPRVAHRNLSRTRSMPLSRTRVKVNKSNPSTSGVVLNSVIKKTEVTDNTYYKFVNEIREN